MATWLKRCAVSMVIPLFLLNGCGTTSSIPKLPAEGKEEIRIIIDYSISGHPADYKSVGDSPLTLDQFTSELKTVFESSFRNVALVNGYGSPKEGEVVIRRSPEASRLAVRGAPSKDWTEWNYHVRAKVEFGSINFTIDRTYGGHFTWSGSELDDAATEFYNEVVSTNKFKSYVKSYVEPIRMARTLPANLEFHAKFSDATGFLPNNSLDAGEKADVIVTIKNIGKGTGYGTILEIVSDNSRIRIEKPAPVGDIPPNGTKEVKIGLRTGLDVEDGKTSLTLSLKEQRGYDAKKVVMNLPTARLLRPQLEIVSTEINDGDTGLAKGNGNGIPENGETIELTAFIKNAGAGQALGVNLGAEDMPSGIQWVRDSVVMGSIQPSEVAKAKLAFSIPRNFEAQEVSTALRATDIRGEGGTRKRVAVTFAKRAPNLYYAYRLLSKGRPVSTLTNGEDYELDLTVSNRGQIPATNVNISVSPVGRIVLPSQSIHVGEVNEQASVSKRVVLSIPRTHTDDQALLAIEVSQADFSSLTETIRLPVAVKIPKLTYVASLQSRNGGNTLEQGESAILEIRVANDGALPATGVKVKIGSRDENLKLAEQTEVVIGKISARSKSETVKLPISTLRKIKLDNTFLDVRLTQEDFPPVASQYALHIQEEGAMVVEVETEGKERRKGSVVAKGQSGPTIHILSPQGVITTAEESVRLAFAVEDKRTIESVTVAVNGIVMLNEKPGLRRKEILQDITLSEGENRVVITAYNADNFPSKKEFILTRLADEDVDIPPITGRNNPDAIAVVIGISRYEEKDIPPVEYARRDAETVRDYLIKTLGFHEKNVLQFYDEQATETKLRSVFNRLKNRVIPGQSEVFVFYSGHGLPESNEPYLAPYDLQPEDIKTTGYAVKDLYKQMEEIKGKRVTIVIDACFSGQSQGGALIKSASPLFTKVSNPVLKMKNGLLFTASTGNQIASWDHKKRHGLFTYYFLRGLRGQADTDRDGMVTVHEMDQYLGKHVAEQARAFYNREQTPEVFGEKSAILLGVQ